MNWAPVLGDLLTGGGGGSGENAAVLRKLGGAAAVVSLIRMEESRDPALALMHQLVLCGNEEDMTALLELLGGDSIETILS